MTGSSRIVVSVTVLRPEEKRIVEAIRADGHDVVVATRRTYAAHFAQSEHKPDLVLMRNVSRDENLRMAHLFESAGVATLNSAAAIQACSGKDMQAMMFARSGLPHPRTHVAFTVDDVCDAFEGLGDVVVKPVNGSWGRGITRITSTSELAAWQAGREITEPRGRELPVIVQQNIPKAGHDIRAVVIGTEVAVVIRRVAEQFRTNTTLGATAEAVPATPEVLSLCARVVDLLGPGIYGVDIVQCGETGEYYLLEINSNPEFARSSDFHEVDIPAMVADVVGRTVTARRDLIDAVVGS